MPVEGVATAAATATVLQRAAMAAVPGETPASTAAGGPPAEEQAQAAAAVGVRSSTGTSTAAPAAAGPQPCLPEPPVMLNPLWSGQEMIERAQ